MIVVNCRSGVLANAAVSRASSSPDRYRLRLLSGFRSMLFAGLSDRIFHRIAIEKIRESRATQRLAA